ncbi:hypothetical protein [Bartonella quintana]|nr:hypothetical protein [Bartonella quintana]
MAIKTFNTLDIGTDTGSVLKLFSGLYTHAAEVVFDSDVFAFICWKYNF